MDPIHIKGDTWYISSPLNVGYINGLMVDSGIDPDEGSAMAEAFLQKNLPLSALINTHSHPDHSGGNIGVLSKGNIPLIATKEQQPFLEQKDLVDTFIFGAEPLNKSKSSRFINSSSSNADIITSYGKQKLGNACVDIIDLRGHWNDCIGIASDDGVLFCGDSLLGSDEIDKFKVPVFYSIEKAVKSLQTIKNSNYDYYVPSHGVLTNDVLPLVEKNLAMIERIVSLTYECCKFPSSREEIAAYLFEKLNICKIPSQFQIVYMTVGAVVSSMCNRGSMREIMKDYKAAFVVI